jgi:MFS family permease
MTTRQRWTLVATIIGSGAVFLDGTIVNVALKQIGQELPATVFGTLEGQTYIVSGYLAVLAALLILAGALSDHYGRRRVYMIGLAGFAATSALCGPAPTMELWSCSGLPRARPAPCSSRDPWPSSPTPSREPPNAAARSASGRRPRPP